LSGGEQQMLNIGRAMGNPTLLLLDVPLEGLAPVIIDVVLNAIEHLKREDDLGILLVEQHARMRLSTSKQRSYWTGAGSFAPIRANRYARHRSASPQ
jgi:branched-chain amino acid transport system ATP-binding protein